MAANDLQMPVSQLLSRLDLQVRFLCVSISRHLTMLMQDHTDAMLREGFCTLADLVAVTDQLNDSDLQSMGLTRMMDRKKLLKVSK